MKDAETLLRIGAQFSLRFGGIALLLLQDALVIHFFDIEFFGRLALFVAVAQIAAMLGIVGQNNYLVFLLVRYQNRGDRERAVRALCFALVLSSTGSFAVGLGLSLVYSYFFPSSDLSLIVLAFTAMFVGIFEVLRQVFRVCDREYITEALLLFGQPISLIFVTMIASFSLGEWTQVSSSLPALIYTCSIALLVIATGLYVIIFTPGLPSLATQDKVLQKSKLVKWSTLYRVWLLQGLPLVFSGLFTNFQQRVDIFVLGLFVQPRTLAVYQILSRISLFGLFVLRSVQSVFLARFAKVIAQSAYKKAGLWHRDLTVFSTFGTVLAFLCSLALEPFFTTAFKISIYDHFILLSVLFLARLMLALAGGAPVFLQMTPSRRRLPQFFGIAVLAFSTVLLLPFTFSETISPMVCGTALVAFNGVYGALCGRELRRFLKLQSMNRLS